MSSENSSQEPVEPGAAPQGPRRLEVVSERIAPDRKRRSSAGLPQREYADLEPIPPIPEPPPIPTAPPTNIGQRDLKVALVFEVISRILAVRLFMMLAVLGAFALGWKVSDMWSAGVFGVFSVGVVLPMILLEYRVRGGQ